MPVNTIVRRIDLAISIPAPVLMCGTALKFLRRLLQDFGRLLVPMNVFSLLLPESFRVLDGGLVDLVLSGGRSACVYRIVATRSQNEWLSDVLKSEEW